MKKKVLYWGDFTSSTGFAQVAHNILKQLYATDQYDFDIVGINFGGEPNGHKQYPNYTLYPAIVALATDPQLKSPYGFKRFLMQAGTGQYDIIFIINDTFVVNSIMPSLLEIQNKLPKDKRFSTVLYFPVDSPLHEPWVKDVVAKVDFPVVYTKYGKAECLRHMPDLDSRLDIIYHGVDKKTFFPLPTEEAKEFRKTFLGQHSDKFVILNVARNQPRKDLHKNFAAFAEFHKEVPNSFLFILAQAEDVGGSLLDMADFYGLKWDVDWGCPRPGTYGAGQGYPVELVNKIYNSCDLVVSTTLGEGWGLSSSEAFATLRPALFPDNTSLHEIIGENEERGWFCKSGADKNQLICLGAGDNNQIRPTVDIYDMAAKMKYIFDHPMEARAKAERAFSEVWTWEQVCEGWKKVFDKAALKTQVRRSNLKIDRNSPCPCLSGRKWKVCCGR